MSARTLRRRLAEAGETFQSLLDQTRKTMASRYLERRDPSIGEIAFLLGFPRLLDGRLLVRVPLFEDRAFVAPKRHELDAARRQTPRRSGERFAALHAF